MNDKTQPAFQPQPIDPLAKSIFPTFAVNAPLPASTAPAPTPAPTRAPSPSRQGLKP